MSEGIPLSKELLDDFYTESEELLGHIHQQLQLLEDKSGVQSQTVGAIYRAVHSLKGLCGIAGLAPAEALAHELEELIRSWGGTQAIDPDELALVSAVANRLDQVIQSHKQHTPAPDVADLRTQLRALSIRVTKSREDATSPALEPTQAGNPQHQPNCVATFQSSRELDSRGVNVSVVRTRLEQLGTIIEATPVVSPEGSVSFRFSMQIDGATDPGALPDWTADGVSFTSPASETASQGQAPSDNGVSKRWIRIDMDRLDELMRIVGDLSVLRSRLGDRIERSAAHDDDLVELNAGFVRTLRDLRKSITRARLVPVSELFTRLPAIAREATRETGKQASLALSGGETEMDKFLIDRLKEPLLHLVRNAVSHGIENTADRERIGKPPVGVVKVAAKGSGSRVTLCIEDDGRGLDERRILEHAREQGITSSGKTSNALLLDLISREGFSTRERADYTAGRGVGMAVVAGVVRELGGMMSVESEAGRFTRFTMDLPMSLSITDAILVGVGRHCCAVPRDLIEVIIQCEASEVRKVNGVDTVNFRGELLPILRMQTLFGDKVHATQRLTVLVIEAHQGMAGLVVDSVHGEREIMVRPLADPLIHTAGVLGATELGDGRPVLVLDALHLCSSVRGSISSDKCA